ncbi:patatin-like phospholipase domain-containing protein 4 [Sorex fumeus]|uniref:patatin-like phospholipase domain-containing protein 4 n=1 Tax=Sorex fumeus TaxID=62283 RepID=UPI0024AD0198|nr:patatin-like phospholipase domain-containing protein 4 [Sorex fumeus]
MTACSKRSQFHSGVLGIYHLGAASALCKHGRKLLKDVKAFAGASAGSLVAKVLLTAPQKLEECKAFTYTFAEEIHGQFFGAMTPCYDFMARLRCGMESILPANAHQLAHRRLHVSITNTRTRQNYLVFSFSSWEDLIKVLLASSFVPIYTGLTLVKYKGQALNPPDDPRPDRPRIPSPMLRAAVLTHLLSRLASLVGARTCSGSHNACAGDGTNGQRK